jgi:hypothetical protein
MNDILQVTVEIIKLFVYASKTVGKYSYLMLNYFPSYTMIIFIPCIVVPSLLSRGGWEPITATNKKIKLGWFDVFILKLNHRINNNCISYEDLILLPFNERFI